MSFSPSGCFPNTFPCHTLSLHPLLPFFLLHLFSTPPVWEQSTWPPTDQTRTDAPFPTTNWTRLAGLTPLPDHSPQSTRDQIRTSPQSVLPESSSHNQWQDPTQRSPERFNAPTGPVCQSRLNFTNTDQFTRNNTASQDSSTKHLSKGLHIEGQPLLLTDNYPRNIKAPLHPRKSKFLLLCSFHHCCDGSAHIPTMHSS